MTTHSRPWNYEVLSPEISLPAGSYAVALDGKVVAGGLDLGVLDIDANSWVAQTTYWYGQRGFDGRVMVTHFRLDAPKKVKIILSNWVPRDMSSQWLLRSVELVRTGS